MKVEITPHGITFGSLTVTACCSDEEKGWVICELTTNKAQIQVYATKTGKVRLFNMKTNTELL